MNKIIDDLKKNSIVYKWMVLGILIGILLSVVAAVRTVYSESVGTGKVTTHDECVMPDETCLSSPNCQEKAPGYEASSCNCPCLLSLPQIIPFGERLNQLIKQYMAIGIGGGFGIGIIIGGHIDQKKNS